MLKIVFVAVQQSLGITCPIMFFHVYRALDDSTDDVHDTEKDEMPEDGELSSSTIR